MITILLCSFQAIGHITRFKMPPLKSESDIVATRNFQGQFYAFFSCEASLISTVNLHFCINNVYQSGNILVSYYLRASEKSLLLSLRKLFCSTSNSNNYVGLLNGYIFFLLRHFIIVVI